MKKFLHIKLISAYFFIMTLCLLSLTVNSQVNNLTNPGNSPYATLQAAINDGATVAGDILELTQNLSEGMVTVNKSVSIDGNGFTLNSTSATYGLSIVVANVSITDIKVESAGTFGIHSDCGSHNLALTNVIVDDCGGSGVALNGSDNAVLTNLTSTNNGGNGLSVSNCDNTVVNGITTSGNTFGVFSAGIGIFTSGIFCLPAGVNGFSLTGAVSISEQTKVYSQKANAAHNISGLSGATISWAVGVGALDRSYWPDKATAYLVVKTIFEPPYNYPNTAVYVAEVATENFYVDDDPAGDNSPPMLINTAINFEVPGKTIFVESGTYNEAVNVNKVLTITGAGSGPAGTIITKPGLTALSLGAGGDAINRVIASNLRLTGSSTGIIVSSFNTIDNIESVSNTVYGVQLNPLNDLVVTNSKFNNNGQVGLKLASTASASNLNFTDCEFNDNALHGWYADANSLAEPILDNVMVTNSTFNNNVNKGIYTERLSNAIFNGITID